MNKQRLEFTCSEGIVIFVLVIALSKTRLVYTDISYYINWQKIRSSLYYLRLLSK